MDKSEIKQIIRDELKDITKTLNRVYEDREDIGIIKETAKDLKEQVKVLTERVFKLEKRVHEDLADHKEVIEGALEVVGEAMGGEEK